MRRGHARRMRSSTLKKVIVMAVNIAQKHYLDLTLNKGCRDGIANSDKRFVPISVKQLLTNKTLLK